MTYRYDTTLYSTALVAVGYMLFGPIGVIFALGAVVLELSKHSSNSKTDDERATTNAYANAKLETICRQRIQAEANAAEAKAIEARRRQRLQAHATNAEYEAQEALRRQRVQAQANAAEANVRRVETQRRQRVEAQDALRRQRIDAQANATKARVKAQDALRRQRVDAQEALRRERVQAQDALRRQRVEAQEALRRKRLQDAANVEETRRRQRVQAQADAAEREAVRRQQIQAQADAAEREALRRQRIQDAANAEETRRRQQIQTQADAAEREALRRQRIQDEANAAAAAAAAVVDNNPLDKFDHWLINIGKDKRGKNTKVPTLWINTIVFCVAHLAEELTSFRPGDYGIHEFPTQSGVTSASIVEYVRDAKKGWLDDEYDPKISKSGPTACPGIGNATAKALAKVGIRTTRQLLEKFNTFSYCSIKSKYR